MTRIAHGVGLFLFVAGLVSAEDTFQIKLQRAAKQGDKFVVAGAASQTQIQKQTAGGQPNENKSYGAMTFEGEVEILEVNATGKIKKAKCVVHSCNMTTAEGGEETQPVAEGTVLTQELKDGEKVITSDKGELAPEVVGLLNDFLPVDSDDEEDLDSTFGAAEAKKVGDEWPINSAKVAEGLGKSMKTQIDPANVTGTVRLAEVVEHEGMQCLALHVEMAVAKVVPPGLETADVKKADINVTMDVGMPVDAALHSVAEAMEMTYELTASMKDPQAGVVELEMTVHNTKEVEYQFAK